MSLTGKILITIAVVAGVSTAAVLGLRSYRNKRKPVSMTGAVIRQSTDPAKETPVANAEVTALESSEVLGTAKSDFFGLFVLHFPRSTRAGDTVTLQFRQPDYQPVDREQTIGTKLEVVRMVPLHGEVEAELDPNAVRVTNVTIRYSTQSDTTTSIGTETKTFQVVNTGNVPCNGQRPCSPDGRWKAADVTESLDAGEGNIFRAARVSCLAGPCPF